MLSSIRFSKVFVNLFISISLIFVSPLLYSQQANTLLVDSFTLVNADTGESLAVYSNNNGTSTGSISLAEAQRISVRVNSNASSIRISGVGAQSRVENHLPHSLLGDENGVYEPWSPGVGVYNILVEPFASPNASGVQGESVTLRLTVADNVVKSSSTISTISKILPSINYLLSSDELVSNSEPNLDVEDVCAAWDSTFPENAFTVTESDRLNLQTLLDQHNVLRLTPGNYQGLNQITVDSNQSIIALSPTLFPNVEIAAGANNIRLEGLRRLNLNFVAGASTRYNCFKNFQEASIVVNGATVERNLFIAFSNANVEVDTSQRGHFSDNRFIKFNTHGIRNRVILNEPGLDPFADRMPMVIKGDTARTSGGNAFLLTDAQTPPGSGYSIEDQSDISFVGVDLEAYNQRNRPNSYAFRVRNTGTFRAIKSSGMNRRFDPDENPAFDIDADQIFMTQFDAETPEPVLRVGPINDLLFSWRNEVSSDLIDDDSNNNDALRVFAQEASGDNDPLGFGRIGFLDDVSFSIGDARLESEPNNLTSSILRSALSDIEPGTASWSIPNFRAIPNPTGPNWNANLNQREDESAAIQAMINENGIAYLEPRTYYVGSTINLNRNQGIVGAGANKTAIVALQPNLDIINLAWNNVDPCEQSTSGFTLAEITLQGGRNGVTATQAGLQVNQSTVSHVTFRNMTNAGILIDGIFGWDNNAQDYVNFVDSQFGFKLVPGTNPGNSCYGVPGEYATLSYMDKTVFYRNQFINLNTAMELGGSRGNNLNGVVESLFEGNTTNAIALNGFNLGFMIASSRFIDNAGDPMIDGNFDTTVVNSFFEAGRGNSMLSSNVTVEGSVFTAGTATNAVVFNQPPLGDFRNPRFFDIYNSTLEIPLGPVTTSDNVAGMFFNNNMVTGSDLDEFLNVIEFVTLLSPTRSQHSRAVLPILRGQSSPGSQLLRGGRWD